MSGEGASAKKTGKGKGGKGNEQPLNVFADIETEADPLPSRDEMGKALTAPIKTHMRPLAASRDRASTMIKRLTSLDRRKLFRRNSLQRYRKKKQPQQRAVKWRQIRQLLDIAQNERRVWSRRGLRYKTLLVPEETVAMLAGITDMAMKENVWYVYVRNGCRVHVLHPRESEGHYRKVVVSGSARAVELVSDRIVHVQTLQETGDPLIDIRKAPVPVYPSIEALRQKGLPVPRVRGVWDFYKGHRGGLPIEEILDRPSPETVRELVEFVEDLIGSRMSGPYSRPDRKVRRQIPHVQRVAHILARLFTKSENRKYLSTAALNQAVSFLCKHEFLKPLRAVLIRCEHFATVETFNILLRKCAERQDMRTFRSLVNSMTGMQIRPDPYTWVAFLECLVSSEERAELFKYMVRKGHLSQTGPMRTALQSTVQDTFLVHLQAGRTVDSFFDLIIQEPVEYNWLSTSLLNKLINTTVTLKAYPAMYRLLQICDEQSLALDSSTLRRILPSFRANIHWALVYLYHYISRPGFKLDSETWEKLFLIAFKGRHYNLCRVFWRYACMSGMSTYKMKQCVLSTLPTNTLKKVRNSEYDNIWRANAGKIIVGIDLNDNDRRHPATELYALIPDGYTDNPVRSLMRGFTEGEERMRQLKLARALVRRDIEVGRRYRPVVPLGMMLDAAALVDLEWKGVARAPEWLVDHAVRVPVEWKGYFSMV